MINTTIKQIALVLMISTLMGCSDKPTDPSSQSTTSNESGQANTTISSADEQTSVQNNETDSQDKELMSTHTNVTINTNYGTIKLALDSEKAPLTVANFVSYAEKGHYDGTIFHRVIPGFMIQGGGFDSSMTQKATLPSIANEANNGLENDHYSIAMARTTEPHSATSQFFINTKNNDFLNYSGSHPSGWGYAVFGQVTEGKEVVDSIEKVATGQKGPHGDVPTQDVVIESVTIDTP